MPFWHIFFNNFEVFNTRAPFTDRDNLNQHREGRISDYIHVK